MINHAYLEAYHQSPPKFGDNHLKIMFQHEHFDMQPEFKIEWIIDEKWTWGQRGRRVCKYRIGWTGYDKSFHKWSTRTHLRNVPATLCNWEDLEQN